MLARRAESERDAATAIGSVRRIAAPQSEMGQQKQQAAAAAAAAAAAVAASQAAASNSACQ